MNNLVTYLIIFAITLAIYMCIKKHQKEGFSMSYDLTPRDPLCLDCYYKKPKECGACGNCGICVRGPFASCVPGDENGPYFKEQCSKWIYTDHKEGKTDKTPETIVTKPWNYFYPRTQEIRWPSPVFRATLG